MGRPLIVRAPAWLVLMLALAGCGAGGGAPTLPIVLAVSPSQGDSETEVELELTGRHFQPRVETDFAASGGTLDGAFRAHVVPSAGGAPMELREVRHLSSERLSARVPAGLEAGTYDVVVVDPSGVEARLGGAYRVTGAAGSAVAFRFTLAPLQRTGVPFPVSLTAVDARDQPVDGFTGTVRLSDTTGSVAPVRAGPFVQGRARTWVTVVTPLGDNRLRAEDDLGHASESEPFEVRNGPPARVSWLGGTLAPVAGACAGPLELEVRDALGASADVEAPLGVPVRADPPEDFTLFSDAACSTPVRDGVLSLAGGRAPVFFRALRAGDLALHALPDALPGHSQVHSVRPGAMASLRISSPARLARAGACSEAVTLEGSDAFGNATAPGQDVEVSLSAPAGSGLTFHSDAACSAVVDGLALPVGTPSRAFHLRAPTEGRWAFSVTARSPSELGSATQEVLVEP